MPNICQHCGTYETVDQPLQSCSGCKRVHYCSKQCQVAAWNGGHKTECRQLAQEASGIGSGVDAHAFEDVTKWVRNTGAERSDLVASLLHQDLAGSKLASHCIFLFATYDGRSRSIHVDSHSVVGFDEVRDMFGSSVHDNIQKVQNGGRTGQRALLDTVCSPVAVRCKLSSHPPMFRFIPELFTHSDLRDLGARPDDSFDVNLVLQRMSHSSCGRRADTQLAQVRAAEYIASPQSFVNMVRKDWKVDVQALLEDDTKWKLQGATLLLHNRELSLHRTHRMLVNVRHDQGHSRLVVSGCLATPITELSQRVPTTMPIVPCLDGDSILEVSETTMAAYNSANNFGEFLAGNAAGLKREAGKGIFLPVVVFYDKDVDVHVFILTISRSRLQRLGEMMWSVEEHNLELLDIIAHLNLTGSERLERNRTETGGDGVDRDAHAPHSQSSNAASSHVSLCGSAENGSSGSGYGAVVCANCRIVEPSDKTNRFARCQGCNIVWYCSRKCQKAHWKAQHKHQCVKVEDH